MNIVLDSNVLISSAFPGASKAAEIIEIAFQEHTVLASSETYAELEDVIWRKKLDAYITYEEREDFLDRFLKDARLIKTTETISACRDPKDNMILELAVAGKADFIITGDQDLLELNPFRNIRIVKPNEFLVALKKK